MLKEPWGRAAIMEISMEILEKLKMELPCDPAASLDMYPKDLKAGSQGDICTPMFTAA